MDDLTKKRLQKQGVGTHRIKVLESLETKGDIPKIKIDTEKVEEIADQIQNEMKVSYSIENKELTIQYSEEIEKLDQE